MALLSDLASALKTRLDTITSLRAYTEQPDTVTVNEQKMVAWVSERLDDEQQESLQGLTMTPFDVVLIGTPVQSGGYARGIRALRPYFSISGQSSLAVAIEGDLTLGGKCDTLSVERSHQRGKYEVNGVEYWGGQTEVRVWHR